MLCVSSMLDESFFYLLFSLRFRFSVIHVAFLPESLLLLRSSTLSLVVQFRISRSIILITKLDIGPVRILIDNLSNSIVSTPKDLAEHTNIYMM